jgi:hypothetical protein
MKRLVIMLLLVAGCTPQPHVEVMVPEALHPSKSVAVVNPDGRSFAFDSDKLRQAVAKELHRAGFDRVATGGGRADLVALVTSELMARPLENGGAGAPYVDRFHGERVLAILEIRDPAGIVVYRAVRVENLSSALTEAKVAATLLRPLELPSR